MTLPTTTDGRPFDLDLLRSWIGQASVTMDTLSVRHARLMAATPGFPQAPFVSGTPLPPLWHWLYFLEGSPESELDRDGHPARGSFLPPMPLANRMWAGSRLEFHAPVAIGASVRKRSVVVSVEHKRGRSSDLVLVTVRHEIFNVDKMAITEEHTIVYKEPASPGMTLPSSATMPRPSHCEPFQATSTMLFRYSALTFNAHRIHYDLGYCRNVEGCENLVVHSALQATLLAGLATRLATRPPRQFHYRGVQPNLLGTPLSLNAAPTEAGLTLWTAQPDGAVSVLAKATF